MKTINYILDGFGFKNLDDFLSSTFGFLNSQNVIKTDLVLGTLVSAVSFLFGFNHLFLIALVVLLGFEWYTGVKASLKRGEQHSSRKFGRMLLKIATYLTPIYILNTFASNSNFPVIMNYEIDPFIWLYWVYVIAIIWQLFVSLLENYKSLGYKFAEVLLKIINKKFYEQFNLEDDNKNPT
ncbi:phage holin family protein [Faecalibacter bovis]|uniref:Phage holin family protein n=1 Tax=Faecalibacter bovis TaxID=2898187 RepID=A0ABX7XE60_9FLAO|nr:phage holin family protein [Faecalibacter bovis]QTV06062.1 phage holin family protein [Faecalibacter bovis]